MNCVLCKNGTTHKGKVTVTFDKKETLVVIREVPAHICSNCGHYYLDSEIAKRVLETSKEAKQKKAELEITKFQVAA